MTDRDALYRAIIASPREDTPRLVYADWLEENGRAEEAEFIRLDCRLDEGGLELPDYVERIVRREELRLWLLAHAPGPKLKLKAGWNLVGGWWEITRRGFPRTFEIRLTGRAGAKAIRRIAAGLEEAFTRMPTRSVGLNVDEPEDLAEFLRQPVVEALDGLHVSMGVLGEEVARLIANSPYLRNLTAIDLDSSPGEAGAGALAQSDNLSRLESLSFGRENVGPAELRALSMGRWFQNLVVLGFNDSGLSEEAFEELGRLPTCARLHTLNLISATNFPISSWNEFANTKSFPNLRQLDLSASDMTGGRMAALAGGIGFRLVSLDLFQCAIGDDGLTDLLAAPWVESLRRLDLCYNSLGPTGARALAGCERLAGLRYLNLTGNRFTSGGLRSVARSRPLRQLITLLIGASSVERQRLRSSDLCEFLQALCLPELRHLDLSGLPVGAEGLHALSDKKFRTLRRLGLSNCGLTDEAVAELLTAPSLQDLLELDLNDNELSTGVKPLANRRVLPHLSLCPLEGNSIDPELARKLMRRPGVKLSV